jgi:hypothetical protein
MQAFIVDFLGCRKKTARARIFAVRKPSRLDWVKRVWILRFSRWQVRFMRTVGVNSTLENAAAGVNVFVGPCAA